MSDRHCQPYTGYTKIHKQKWKGKKEMKNWKHKKGNGKKERNGKQKWEQIEMKNGKIGNDRSMENGRKIENKWKF